jgi:hypothetical protein
VNPQLKAKETINALKEEIQNLSKLVEKGYAIDQPSVAGPMAGLTRCCTHRAGLSLGQENMVKELVKVRDDLQVCDPSSLGDGP